MMGIVHGALRRDLTRAADALSREPFPGDAQRVAIAQHMLAMMRFLHLHHSGEDAWLWPTMRRLNPASSDVLDQMDADTVTEAAAAYQKSATGREPLLQTLRDLQGTLDPHLRREEDEMMPIVARTLTAAQWDAWERDFYVKTKSKKELRLEGHRLIDGGDRTVYNHVVGTVNPVLRLVLLRVFGPKYQQACAIRWGADVPVGPKLGEAATIEQPEIIGARRRPWRTRAEVSVHIQAPPERVYDLVTDLASASTRSKEVQSCFWFEGLPPGTVGSRFRGRSRAGLIRWSRICEVVAATRGEQFAFRTVPEQLDPTRQDSCIWGYDFEPDGTGTRITHYYNFAQPPRPWLLTLYGIVMPHHRDPRPALRHTLKQLKVTAEAP
jgi:hypothetical protein